MRMMANVSRNSRENGVFVVRHSWQLVEGPSTDPERAVECIEVKVQHIAPG